MPGNLCCSNACRIVLLVGGVMATVEDRTGCPKRGALLMYNHSSNLDPLIVSSFCGGHQKFVYKAEIHKIPFLGWCLYLYQHFPIQRQNKEQAIAALDKAVQDVVKHDHCISIAPEGTRSKSGELLPFKKGPFHMAMQCKARILPVVISGAHRLWPPHSLFFRAGRVHVTLAEQVKMTEDDTVDTLSDRTREVFVKILTEKKPVNALLDGVVMSLPSVAWLAMTAVFVNHCFVLF